MSPAAPTAPTQADDPLRVDTLVGLNELWQESRGDPEITIAVLDGPVDTSHPSLARAAITQVDFMGSSPANGPAEQHGTHTASVIFGQHDSSVKGIAPLCRGLVIPIFRNSSQGTIAPCSQPDLARAIRAATNAGAHVINVSAGQFATCGIAHPMLVDAVRHCALQGRLVVAAAGNDGCDCLHVPGALPSVLAVGAMNARGEPLPSSNWGEIYQFQGILAPGQHILGAVPAGGVAPRSGTSFAAAMVSGIAGLLLSLQKKRGEEPNPLQVRAALLRTAQGCDGEVSTASDRFLAGRLNIGGAVQFLTRGVQHMFQNTSTHDSGSAADTLRHEQSKPTVTVAPTHEAGAGNVLRDDGGSSMPPGGRPLVPSTFEPSPAPAVMPAACGCGCNNGTKQKVYVIGELDIDLISPSRRDSLEEQNTGVLYPSDTIFDRNVFLRYLLGWKGGSKNAAKLGRAPNGNLHVAESVNWVLRQGQCPLYVIRPQGPFAAAAYQQLIVFLIEQSFADYDQFKEAEIGEECLDECFYPCHGGQQQHFRDFLAQSPVNQPRTKGEPAAEQKSKEQAGKGQAEARFTPEQLMESALTTFADETQPHVVIAGEIAGQAQLYSGETVEVICPVMRGMQNWNTRRLVEAVLNALPAGYRDILGAELQVLVLALLSKLYELIRNNGQDPCDRAKNYFVTAQLFNFAQTLASPLFLKLLGALKPGGQIDQAQLVNIAVDTLICKPASCARYGAEPFDVELSFYNFANQFMGTAVLAAMVDVSDVVPAALEPRPRLFPRRS
jgi:cyanobactin maturation PatA/PatG family protease